MLWANRFAIDLRLIWGLAATGVFALIALAVIPMEAITRLPTACPFKRIFGMDCYGCGMTRAVSAFLHGNFGTALTYNRGVLFIVPLLAALALLPVGLGRRRHV